MSLALSFQINQTIAAPLPKPSRWHINRYLFGEKVRHTKKNTITWIDFLAGEIPKRFQWDHTSLQKRKLISCNNAWEIHGVMILLYVISQISKHRQEHHLRGHYALLYTIEKITRILNKETSVLLQFSLTVRGFPLKTVWSKGLEYDWACSSPLV